ncbi:MAG: hypothetical protein GDA56_01160 [Hormoscilla sp. GM7CHS1pb]|nr:hypothetical protein [Hormoscilla sp. GM7CHS1pb]
MVFRYQIVKKSVGNSAYTTRPDLGAPLTESELIAEVEAATSITKGDLQNTFSTVRRILLQTARSGRGSETLFNFFRISLASGGSIEDPEETITKEEIHPRIVVYMAATVQREFSKNLPIKRTGIASNRLPQIDVVRNMATENLDAYTLVTSYG